MVVGYAIIKNEVCVLKTKKVGIKEVKISVSCERIIKMTNANRIRRMTDVELAELLSEAEAAGYNDSSITPKDKYGYNMNLLEWLQAEIKE